MNPKKFHPSELAPSPVSTLLAQGTTNGTFQQLRAIDLEFSSYLFQLIADILVKNMV
jgi:hypothetical protein